MCAGFVCVFALCARVRACVCMRFFYACEGVIMCVRLSVCVAVFYACESFSRVCDG